MNRLVFVFEDSMLCCNLGVVWLVLLINRREIGPFAGGCILCEYIFMYFLWDTINDWCVVGFFLPIWHPQVVWSVEIATTDPSRCGDPQRSNQQNSTWSSSLGDCKWVECNFFHHSHTWNLLKRKELSLSDKASVKLSRKEELRRRRTHQQRVSIRLTKSKRLETITPSTRLCQEWNVAWCDVKFSDGC